MCSKSIDCLCQCNTFLGWVNPSQMCGPVRLQIQISLSRKWICWNQEKRFLHGVATTFLEAHFLFQYFTPSNHVNFCLVKHGLLQKLAIAPGLEKIIFWRGLIELSLPRTNQDYWRELIELTMQRTNQVPLLLYHIILLYNHCIIIIIIELSLPRTNQVPLLCEISSTLLLMWPRQGLTAVI